MPNLMELVAAWLKANGYDGLFNDDCGCRLEDLMPCCEPSQWCEAGVIRPCLNPADCEGAGDANHIHIGPRPEGDGSEDSKEGPEKKL